MACPAAIGSKRLPTFDRIPELELDQMREEACSQGIQLVFTEKSQPFFFFGFKYLVRPWNQITSAGLPLIWIDLS